MLVRGFHRGCGDFERRTRGGDAGGGRGCKVGFAHPAEVAAEGFHQRVRVPAAMTTTIAGKVSWTRAANDLDAMIRYSHYPCRSHHVLAAQSVGSRLELAAADDCDLRLGVPLRGPLLLHRQHHVGALEHLPEHYVFPVEVRHRLRRDEEL